MRLFRQTRLEDTLFIDCSVARELTAIADVARRRADIPEVLEDPKFVLVVHRTRTRRMTALLILH